MFIKGINQQSIADAVRSQKSIIIIIIVFREERLVGRYVKRKMKEESEVKGSKDARKKFREGRGKRGKQE